MTNAALKLVAEDSDMVEGSGAATPSPLAGETPTPEVVKAAPAWVTKLKQFDGAALFKNIWPPVLGVLIFLGLWAVLAPSVKTSLGALPGPVDVFDQFRVLIAEHNAARAEAAAVVASGAIYSGSPTFVDQIFTSLETVGLGFILATIFAVPIGLIAGLSKTFNAAINPIIQIMKPVSPLAWLPIVTMVVSASVTNADPMLAKSFVISAVTVMLCSLWPTLINTAVGVASIDKDLLNVGRVLRLGWFAKLTKLVLPSAVPYIFTGMRLSLGVGWMVLIAAEMLAQNPGLGKFVWDEFQNGSEKSLSRIMVAVVVIGLIGFALDRIMAAAQSYASRNAAR
jgi:nitrate/nitrite transport system permease protein